MPVSSILAYLASGMSVDEFLKDFDWLTKEDVLEAISFASVMLEDKFIPLDES